MTTNIRITCNSRGIPVYRDTLDNYGSEEYNQAVLTTHIHADAVLLPEPRLELYHHIPNGGMRNKVTAAKLKAEGVLAGVSDISLPVPSGGYHGLYIELKVGNNGPRQAQLDFLTSVQAQGYYACICYGWRAAHKVILDYLNDPDTLAKGFLE